MMKYRVESSSKWLYPDDVVDTSTDRRSAKVISAKGGYASFQVLFNGLTVGETIKCAFDGDDDFYPEAFQEYDVNVTNNTGVHGFIADYATAKDYVTREAPFRVFDALKPMTSDCKVRASTEVVYISIKVPGSAHSGKYDLTATIKIGDDEVEIPIELEVTKAVIAMESLYITNWFSVGNMAKSHGLEPYSEAHWNMIRYYGEAMRRGRQNCFWVTWDTVIKSGSFEEGYTFDFSRTKKLIEMYLGMGFTCIEGAPVCGRDDWDAVVFKVSAPDGRFEALSEQGYTYLSQLLTEWRDFIDDNEWTNLLIQHIGDEPHGRCADEYRILSGIVRKYLPGVPLIEAIETHTLYGAVDIWVPKNDYYSRNMEELEKHRKLGDRIWIYTCCIPGGFYANRLLDMPLLRTRMIHWGNYKYNIEGFLHWGLNHWRGNQNPFEETCPSNGPTNFLPAGDTNIVYPGDDGDVWISMRLEQMRAGAEEYELLKQLGGKGDELMDKCFRAFDDCDNNPEEFDKVREELLRLR
jgi:hypothetical protein